MIRESPLSILVISDEKRGHFNPCLGVAKQLISLAGGGSYTVLHPQVPARSALGLRVAMRVHLPNYWTAERARYLLESQVGLPPKVIERKANVVLSAGTYAAPFGALMARSMGALAVSLTRPNLIPAACFDLLCIPLHDVRGDPAPNVVPLLLTPSNFTRDESRKAAREMAAARNFGARFRYTAFLVGGSTKRFRLPSGKVLDTARLLLDYAHDSGEKLLITTSRRTPKGIERALKSIFENQPNVACAVWAGESAENPVPAFLGLADKVIVTEDSFSMVSEAASIGTRPFVLKLGMRRKFARSYSRLAGEGYIQWDPPERLPAYLNAFVSGRGYDAAGLAAMAILRRLERA